MSYVVTKDISYISGSWLRKMDMLIERGQFQEKFSDMPNTGCPIKNRPTLDECHFFTERGFRSLSFVLISMSLYLSLTSYCGRTPSLKARQSQIKT